MRVTPQSVGIIHFVGIGGIGMSGIAAILHSLGYNVRGSDVSESANVERLRALGIPVIIGHQANNVQDAALLVVSSDIRADNAELIAARTLSLPIVRRADMLAELMHLKPAIAVAGTHGKTSTTSLGAAILDAGDFDPTVVSGGIITAYGTNARLGSGEWIIVEADESDGTFVRLPATIAIVTNIDPEHLEYYGSFEAMRQAFRTFLSNIPFYGLGIVCLDHPEIRDMLPLVSDRRMVTYGFAKDADVRAEAMTLDASGAVFDVVISERFHTLCKNAPQVSKIEGLRSPMVGAHNVQNALSIIAMALELGMTIDQIRAGFQSFKGVGRRFTKTGEPLGLTVIDDYAHHPVEIATVLKAAKEIAPGRVIAVVQPHRYSRLQSLYADFTQCLGDADLVILAPVYSAGEKPIAGLDHYKLAGDIKDVEVIVIEDQDALAPVVLDLSEPGDFVVCMGAGSITHWAHQLPETLEALAQATLKTVARG